jgi:tyrosine-protein phosphatase YwqE
MGLFTNIFAKKNSLTPVDLSFLKTDIHSHLIPGIDDGAKSIDDSISLIKGLQELGYENIITTPHIMTPHYKNTPNIIKKGLISVKESLLKNNINTKIGIGAEYYIDYDFISKIGKEELLTFGDNYILVELSFGEPPRGIKEAFFELQINGYKPILAHPERYLYWMDNKKVLFDLKDNDILFQTNLLSLAGYYGKESIKMGEMLLENNLVEWLGTDLHNSNQLRLLKEYKLKNNIAKLIEKTDFLNQTL